MRRKPQTIDEMADWVLQKVIKILDEFGWHQGSLGDQATGFCVMGALNEAIYGSPYLLLIKTPVKSQIYTCAVRRIRDQIGGAAYDGVTNLACIAIWNDAAYRTAEDVKLVIKKAARHHDG